MNDKDIIVALECCIKSNHLGDCFRNGCPLVSEHGCKVGKETLYPYANDLIKRQQAEIERLKAKQKSLYKDIERIALMTSEREKMLGKEDEGK